MKRNSEYDFVVTLKRPDYIVYNLISILMCAMAVTASIFGVLHSGYNLMEWISIILIAFVIISLVITYKKINSKDTIISHKLPLFASAFLWFFTLNNFFIAACYLIAAFLEWQVKFPQEVGFYNEGAVLNSFPFKHYEWKEIKYVILKDNMLTIDFKNNRIFQKEIESEVAGDIEQEFNEFCDMHKQQVTAENY